MAAINTSLFIGNTNRVLLTGLTNEETGAAINDATVTFTVKNSAGSAVSGASAVSMTYVTGSSGNYSGICPSTVSLTDGATYFVEVTATKSGVGVGFWRDDRVAQYRRKR